VGPRLSSESAADLIGTILDGDHRLLYDQAAAQGIKRQSRAWAAERAGFKLTFQSREIIMLNRTLAVITGLALIASPASAQVEQLLKGITGSGVTDSKASAGLKEALQVATEKAVALTGRPNGYFSDAAIKILMPQKLQTMQQGLRAVGYGPQIDEFVLSMNRAAEQAAPAAKQIFGEAITSMTFDDAKKILSGGNTSATDYFKAKTTDKLTAAFKPVIDKSMSEVGVTRQYQALMGKFETIPFAKTQSFDLDNYVTSKALDGLFHVVGEQEKAIRTNPAARTTELLKEVFAKK
jgi:Protein of unknown function (DUF4197)